MASLAVAPQIALAATAPMASIFYGVTNGKSTNPCHNSYSLDTIDPDCSNATKPCSSIQYRWSQLFQIPNPAAVAAALMPLIPDIPIPPNPAAVTAVAPILEASV